MPNLPKSGALRRFLIPLLLLSATPALAQSLAVQPPAASADPAELLAQALRTLATEPNNLSALTAAGRNALVLGDPNAAVGFFGRAQEIAPNSGAVKAGLGSALVQLERPQDALRLFGQASRLGVADADIAEDRGLAYDLTGDQARAQADYRTVLAVRPEDDTARRRLALSLGISGQKAAAITMLDPLIRKRDIAGWRAQTFVLAMSGDAKGANDITRIMLPQQATMLQPFLVRLATLSPADKARAVHFGEMPATGATYTPTQVASVDTPATYASAPVRQPAPTPRSDLAPPPVRTPPSPVPVPAPAVTVPVVTAPAAAAPSRVAVSAPLADIALTPAPAVTAPTPVPAPLPATQVAQAAPLRPEIAGPPAPPLADLPTPAAEGHYDLPHDVAPRAAARPVRPAPVPPKTIATPVVHGKTAPIEEADDVPAAAPVKKPSKAAAKTELTTADDSDTKPSKKRGSKASAKDDDADTPPIKASKASAKAKTAEADDEDCTPAPKSKSKAHGKASAKKKKPSTTCTKLASADDDSGTATASSSKTKKGGKSKTAADDTDDSSTKSSRSSKSAKATKEKPAVERVYVQVAGGANRDDMDKAWAGVKKKAPELMKGRTPSTTPLRATNRLLVGPFKDEDEAQAFVNKMAAKGLSGFTFKSSKGQKVEKVGADQ